MPLQPSVSVGNVGQLTVDLIVSTLHMDRVGYLTTDAVYPIIGNDPFSTRGSRGKCLLVTAIEGTYVFRYSEHLLLNKNVFHAQLCKSCDTSQKRPEVLLSKTMLVAASQIRADLMQPCFLIIKIKFI